MRYRTPCFLLLAPLLSIAVGCASSPLHEAARDGQWETLRTGLVSEEARAELDADAVRALAETVLAREILETRDDDARVAIEYVRPCAAAVAGPLEQRAKRGGKAAASALLALHEAGLITRGRLAEHIEDDDPALRAVGTRALVRADDAELRRERIADADERVRIQALAAAMHARDPGDVAHLLEAARLDPSRTARTMALRAAGALGGPEVAARLRDLWANADDADRRTIVEAWATPQTAQAGGIEQLRRVVDTKSGAPAILAAAVLAKTDDVSAARAKTLLARAIETGPHRERILAIRRAPIGEESILAALRAAAADSDVSVRIAALGRLTESPDDREGALTTLASLAEGGALSAALGLARAKDPRAVAHLRQGLAADDPDLRSLVGKSLAEAGEYRRAAELLGDASAKVRAEVGCALLISLP